MVMIRKQLGQLNSHRSTMINGFGMTEMLVSLAAGGLIIVGSGAALQSMQSMMSTSGSRATLRQNTSNGLKLLRTETTKADHLLVFETGQRIGEETDLNNYNGENGAISLCKNASSGTFEPLFGLRNSRQLAKLPIIYGVGLNANGFRYSLYRCGPAIASDGSYDTSNIYVATILDDIGVMPKKTCMDDQKNLIDCEEPVEISKEVGDKEVMKSISEILTDTINRPNYGYSVQGDTSPSRTYREPALRFGTDQQRRLLTFIPPNSDYLDSRDEAIPSFLQMSTGLKSLSMQSLQFTAYARADKRITQDINGSVVLDGLFFRGEIKDNIRFLLDGSGSMKSCIYQSPTPVYVVSRRGWWGRSGRARATYPCIVNRMQALKAELRTLLQDLHETAPNTMIGLESFSVTGNNNHKGWSFNGQSMNRVGSEEVLDSVFAFIDTIDEFQGGATNPWPGLQTALNDTNADTLFFLSDGEPTRDPDFGSGSKYNNFKGTADDLNNMNNNRAEPMIINSISLGLESEWMMELADLTGGDYNYVDVEDVAAEQQQEDSNASL